MYFDQIMEDIHWYYLRMTDGSVHYGNIDATTHLILTVYLFDGLLTEKEISRNIEGITARDNIGLDKALEDFIYEFDPGEKITSDESYIDRSMSDSNMMTWQVSRDILLKRDYDKQPQGFA